MMDNIINNFNTMKDRQSNIDRRNFNIVAASSVVALAAVSSVTPAGGVNHQTEPKQTMCNAKLIDRLLDLIENEIVPLTRKEIKKGNKIFGAAIVRKDDLSTVVIGSNNETENPLWHGEVHTIKLLYEMPKSERPHPKDVIFFATHEPCPLCLSAITWSGYDNFYYLFSHEDSRDSFNIGHDLKILKEVFNHDPGGYARQNAYWKAHSIRDLITICDQSTQQGFLDRIEKLKENYAQMSEIYQQNKDDTDIPLK
jgi:tRNA(Arg) A34 adenosine deaminase TadA